MTLLWFIIFNSREVLLIQTIVSCCAIERECTWKFQYYLFIHKILVEKYSFDEAIKHKEDTR